MTPVGPEVTVVGALAAYNLVQNLVIPENAYVPANLVVTAGLVAFARNSGMPLDAIGLGEAQLGDGLRLGGTVAAALGAAFIAASSTRLLDRWLLDERARGHESGGAAYRSLVRFPLGTALFEEVAFRGVLDGLWRRRAGAHTARLVGSAAFGAWHLLPTFRGYPGMGIRNGRSASIRERCIAALSGAVITGLSGFGFTALRERSDSVAAPWLTHAAINAGSYLLARRAWQATGG
ncbi:MAG: CPBP family intramembrane metalloprotease [Acidimicrobiia bacterium]|nr:CPBP family intramembrane metalloprotease [Acidimicrobiia bacterium]